MPFQDNPTMRPLYDTLNGGPPRAWECKIMEDLVIEGNRVGEKECGKITKTLQGMITHQRVVHKFEPQLEIEHGRANETGDAGPGGKISECGSVDDRRDPETLPGNGIPSHKDD